MNSAKYELKNSITKLPQFSTMSIQTQNIDNAKWKKKKKQKCNLHKSLRYFPSCPKVIS